MGRKKEGKTKEIKRQNKKRKMEMKRLFFPSFPSELLNICTREIPLPTSDGDTAAGVNAKATEPNDGPRQTRAGGTGGPSKPLIPSLLGRKLPFSSIFSNPLIDSQSPCPQCSSQIPSSPPVLFSQHQAQG